jgi:hypothetical protein
MVGRFFDALQTDNLPVELKAVNSRHATQDDHERLAGFAGQRLAFGVTGQPTILGGVASPAFAFLSQTGGGHQPDSTKNEQSQQQLFHETISRKEATDFLMD